MKKIVVIIVSAMSLVALIAIGILFYLNSDDVRIRKQLDLGQKYLSDLDYEQAIAAYETVLDIDPHNEEANSGIVDASTGLGQKYFDESQYEQAIDVLDKAFKIDSDNSDVVDVMAAAYMAWSTELINNEMYEQAIKILEDGIDQLGKKELTDLLEKTKEQYELYKTQKEMEELFASVQGIFIEIAELNAKEDYEGIFSLMGTTEYEEVLSKIEFLKDKYIFDTEFGKVGIYSIKSEQYGNYMIYLGDYEADVRQGDGVWIGYYEGNNYIARGAWANDMPNGESNVREWNSSLSETVVYRVISGNVRDGLWDGVVNWCFEEGEKIRTFPVTFEQGKWVVIRIENDDDGEHRIVSEHSLEDAESGTMRTSSDGDTLEGIEGFIAD